MKSSRFKAVGLFVPIAVNGPLGAAVIHAGGRIVLTRFGSTMNAFPFAGWPGGVFPAANPEIVV